MLEASGTLFSIIKCYELLELSSTRREVVCQLLLHNKIRDRENVIKHGTNMIMGDLVLRCINNDVIQIVED